MVCSACGLGAHNVTGCGVTAAQRAGWTERRLWGLDLKALIRLVQSAELEHQLTGANKLWGLHEVEKQERVIGVLLAAGEHEGGRATGRAAPTADGRGKALAAKVKAADEDEDGVVVIEERVGERKRNSAMEKALRQSRAYNGRFAGGKLKPKGTVAGGGGGSGRGDGSVTAAVVVPGLVPPAPKRPRTGSRPPPQPRAIEFREHEVAMVKEGEAVGYLDLAAGGLRIRLRAGGTQYSAMLPLAIEAEPDN